MSTPSRSRDTDWRGEWLSMNDLARLLGKSRPTICKLRRTDPNLCSGIRIIRVGTRVWAWVDRSLLPNPLL